MGSVIAKAFGAPIPPDARPRGDPPPRGFRYSANDNHFKYVLSHCQSPKLVNEFHENTAEVCYIVSDWEQLVGRSSVSGVIAVAEPGILRSKLPGALRPRIQEFSLAAAGRPRETARWVLSAPSSFNRTPPFLVYGQFHHRTQVVGDANGPPAAITIRA